MPHASPLRLAHPARWLIAAACCTCAGAAQTPQAAPCTERNTAIAHALELRRTGNDPQALRCLERARTALPNDAVILTDLGILADALHHYNEAAQSLQTALALDPGNPTALYGLARTDADRDRPAEAEPLFRAYLAQRPNDATAHYGLGRLFQLAERTDEAAAEFNRSIALQPVQTEAYFQLGQMALDASRDDEARGFFAKTLARMPAHGGALTGMGIVDYRRKQYPAARQSLEVAIAASPDFQTAHYYLGLALVRLGDKDGGKRELALAATLTARQQDKSQPIGVDGYPR